MTEQGSSGQRPLTSQSQAFTNANQLTMATGPSMSGAGDGLDSLAPIFPPAGFDVPDISFSNSVIPNADFNSSMLNSSSQMFASPGVQYADAPSASAGAGQAQKNYFPPSSNSPPGTSSSDDSDDLPLAQLAKRGLVAGTGVGSPSGLGTDTTSLENSPISNTKKAKTAKRKKKKDPNEPQKPVSAYALFFRDTQATIKGHNPNASFGDVSKIVASMWDQLDPEHKDVYKKKTETAKKQYLKQLAAYRASQVSQSAMDESESSLSPPSAMTPTGATVISLMQHSGAVSQPGFTSLITCSLAK
ncbi:hypothetical protein Btru_043929 [Bulinus truncatus]|nr:hypothetical protein Btru_043929 [Bulinus truncatus]